MAASSTRKPRPLRPSARRSVQSKANVPEPPMEATNAVATDTKRPDLRIHGSRRLGGLAAAEFTAEFTPTLPAILSRPSTTTSPRPAVFDGGGCAATNAALGSPICTDRAGATRRGIQRCGFPTSLRHRRANRPRVARSKRPARFPPSAGAYGLPTRLQSGDHPLEFVGVERQIADFAARPLV